MFDDIAYTLVLLQEMCQGYNNGVYYVRVSQTLQKHQILTQVYERWRLKIVTTRQLLRALEEYVCEQISTNQPSVSR